ncbi:DUF5011 domain-containing protein [Akkermansiaceae bacterium]|nr:DUF5011 domain-containing protein [Akkermansiaceae bacterium]
MIVDNGDGTYGVRFYDNDGAERWVTVDKFVPGHREDNLLFAGTNSGESWAMLVEKAYVQLNESDNISQDGTNRYGIGNAFGIAGGDSGQALSHLTGQKASYGFIDSEPGNEWTADKLRALLDQDLPLVFSTGAPCALASSYNVKRRHAYTYESYDPQTQKFYLRNAWGFEHAYVTFEGLQVMGSNIAYLDGTKTKMERIDANSTFSAAFGAYGDDEESEAGLTAVESFGSVTLYTDTNNRLYAGSVAQGIKPVRINGQLATLSLNERTAIAAESIGGINQILWRDNYSQALIKMNFDSSWQFLPTDNVVMVSGTPEFNAAELAFGEGGNVDNTAPVITVISGTNTDYTNTAIATDSSNSTLYDKSLHVNGLEIVQGAEISGQAAVPDLFTEKVAQVVKLMISRSGADIDDAAQENMVRTLKGEAGTWHATKPTAQRVLRGAGADYSPNPLVDSNYSSYSGLQSFQDTHSTKDMIWYLNSDAESSSGDADITEVVEHLMHTIHSYGVRGGVSGSINGLSWIPDSDPDWKTRELFLALKQAVDNGVFSLSDYGDGNYNTASTFELAVIEYLYLLNFNMWEYSTLWDGGSLAPEWNDNSRTPSGIQANNPLGYALYNKYINPVLTKPSLSALRSIFQDGDVGDPAIAGSSGYTPGDGNVTDTVERGVTWTDAGATADTGETVTASGIVDTSAAGNYTITYTATDAAGNTGTATRTVTVLGSGGGESFGDVVVYANNSAALIGQVTIEGEFAESGDVVAIYVGSELRGKQEVVINGSVEATEQLGWYGYFNRDLHINGVAWVNAQVQVNAAGGDETISFKVYDASTGVTHEKSNTSAVITTGGTVVGPGVGLLIIEMKEPNGDPVKDTTAPVITVASLTKTVEQGATWTDAVATADTGETVTASGAVDTSLVGIYTITYTATDAAGNIGTATRTVTVVEPEPAQFVTLTVNQPSGGFIDYTAIHEKGATATITAIANSTNFFDGWSGDGSFAPLNADGSKAALLMDGDKTITAIFSARRSPVITSGATGMDLLENSGLGSTVYTITASSDSGGLSYAIAGADASLLSVNSASGVVSLTANPDYETKSSYSFNVTATDGLTSAPTEVTFSISNVDEVVPTITSGAIGINLAENSGPGQAVYTITAAANDGGTLLSYAIAGIDSASLSVDSQGVVSLDAVPDYETKSSYSFNVTATDAAGTSAATAVTFSIIDTTAPVITVISGTDTVELGSSWTDAGATTTEGTISATGAVDEDVAGNYTITYTASDAAGNVGTATRAVTVLPVAQTFVITVSSASSGNGNRYFVNDVEAPALQLDPGKTYVFDLSDISTGNHPLAFNPEDVGWTLDIRSVGKHLFVTVPANALGTGEYYCTAHAGMGNLIAFGDTTAPVITLVGNATPKVEAGFPYNDAGATADGGETVTASGTVNTSVVGTYTITYTATDASGNVGTATRTVIVEDTISPVITVTTGNDTVERGSSWTNAGATTTEGSISFTGSVNTDAVGTYTITYSATDSSNNTTTATRTVTVVSSGGEDSFGDVVVYPNNSTQLIGQVTIEGEVAESGDVVAIYVGNELRGKQEVITNGGVAWVNVLVNAAGGNETISFKVYDASTGVTHEKSKSSAVISTGGTVGSFASPLMIEMKDFETQTLSLKEGWNLVSFYVEADDMSPATVFAPIQGKLLQVKNLTQSYDPSVPSFLNTLSSLSVKDGYWLKVSEDVSLSVEGAVPAGASITVKSGWNLVGYPRLSGEAVAEELTSLGNTVVQIKDLGSSYDPSVPSFLNTLSTMAPGSGYWLNVNADGTWNVGTVVEISELNFAAVKTRSDHSPEEKAGPSWGEATVYPNIGATVLAKVSIQGKPVAKGGVVAAFVGNELRGLQDVVLHEGISYVTLNVNLNGEESVSYRVWNPDDNNEYLVSGSMLLELGSTYGKPELLELDAVTVVDKPFQVFNVTSEPFGFSFNTMAGRNYTVEATGDLRTWKAVELFQGSGGEIRFTAKPASTGKPQFFRVSVE